MTITLSFLGAASTVTGSCYLLEHPAGRLLIDCGMFQGPKTLRELNYNPFPFDPGAIDVVLLTHAHIDHSGLLPKLVAAGFRGPIWATEGTGQLLGFMLPDSGHIQETEVAQLNRRNAQRGLPPVTPIYTQADAEASLRRLRAAPYDTWTDIAPGLRARYWNAGHILGSASIELELAQGGGDPLRLLFSGDLGPANKLFHPDPQGPGGVDYLVVESTYGDRERPAVDLAERRARLREEVSAALARGGNLLIPAFAVERSQELLLDLAALFAAGDLPRAQVFLDSPLALRATKVFAAHAGELEDMPQGTDPFAWPNLHFVETVEQSKALNRMKGGAIILSASGMCEAGRIRHHLKAHLWKPETTVLLVGYQAVGTLGRLLQDGVERVRIHGEEVAVRATIRRLEAYSGHADRAALLAWVKARLPVRHAIFLTHGDDGPRAAFKEGIVALGHPAADVLIPQLDARYRLAADGAQALDAAPRLDPAGAAAPDWYNEQAALLLDLKKKLRKLPDAKTRTRLVRQLRNTLMREAMIDRE